MSDDALRRARQISRSEFMRTISLRSLPAAGALALLPRLAGQKAVAPSPPSSGGWSDAAVKKLRTMQEASYSRVGQALGLGSDPQAAYRVLSTDRIPTEKISVKSFEDTFGSTFGKSQGLAGAEEIIRGYSKYRNAEVPTPYEDPTLYGVLLEMADSIYGTILDMSRSSDTMARLVRATPQHLLFGTLPAGDPNAMSVLVPQTKEYIVLFHYGLFEFAFNMAKIAAKVFPPLVPRGNQAAFSGEPNPAAALRRQPEILSQFNRILYAYVVMGNPRWAPNFRLDTPYVPAAAILLRSMELFVLGHEYTHVIWRHAERGPEYQRTDADVIRWKQQAELDADEVGLSLMDRVMSLPNYSYWGADYSMSCLDILYRCLSVLQQGAVISDTKQADHPSPVVRREKLRALLRELRPGEETESSIRLGVQLQNFLDTLWQQSLPGWMGLYKRGNRPSSIWSG